MLATKVKGEGEGLKLNWQIGERDIKLLEQVGRMEIKAIATERGMTQAAVLAHLHRIRARVHRYQLYLNKIRTMQRNNPRIRKFTTTGKLREEDIEEWEEP